jgi:hypothetical protein
MCVCVCVCACMHVYMRLCAVCMHVYMCLCAKCHRRRIQGNSTTDNDNKVWCLLVCVSLSWCLLVCVYVCVCNYNIFFSGFSLVCMYVFVCMYVYACVISSNRCLRSA